MLIKVTIFLSDVRGIMQAAISGKQYSKQDYLKPCVWQHHSAPMANGATTDILIFHAEYWQLPCITLHNDTAVN